jgi:CRP/FNR family cyclic AMP-dependent transcriptional regulator
MMQIACSASTLRALPLFSALSDAERDAIQPWTQLRTYPARSPILRTGDNADGLYLVLAGRVNVVLEDNRGHKVIVDGLAENDTFGELALFDNRPSLQTFEAQRPCEILYVPRRPLLDIMSHNCSAAMFIATALAQRLGSAYRKLGSLAHDDVYARVMEILLSRGHEQDGAWYVDVGAEAMSSMVGASREMVSRVMKDLVTRGLVRRQKRKLVVDNRAALEQWATLRKNTPHDRKAAAAARAASPAPETVSAG